MSGSVKTYMKKTLTHHQGQGYVRAIQITERNLRVGALDFVTAHTDATAIWPAKGAPKKLNDPRIRLKTGKGWRVARPGQYIVRVPATSEQIEWTTKKYNYRVMDEKDFEAYYKQVKLFGVSRSYATPFPVPPAAPII